MDEERLTDAQIEHPHNATSRHPEAQAQVVGEEVSGLLEAVRWG